MTNRFYDHIKQYVELSPSDFDSVLNRFELKNSAKKEMLQTAEDHCNTLYFVLVGCLNMYFLTEKGTERTVQFAIEGWWLTDFLQFQKGGKTNFNIQAVTQTTLLAISRENYKALLEDYPIMERYFRKVYQIAYGASLVKMRYLYDLSKEEIYFHFTENFPEFAQRVPQKLIASFLGLTPEYVSEIRAKKRS